MAWVYIRGLWAEAGADHLRKSLLILVSQVQGMHHIEMSSKSQPLGKSRAQQEASLQDFLSCLKSLDRQWPCFFGHELYFNLFQ